MLRRYASGYDSGYASPRVQHPSYIKLRDPHFGRTNINFEKLLVRKLIQVIKLAFALIDMIETRISMSNRFRVLGVSGFRLSHETY